jgi:hypothetical protein
MHIVLRYADELGCSCKPGKFSVIHQPFHWYNGSSSSSNEVHPSVSLRIIELVICISSRVIVVDSGFDPCPHGHSISEYDVHTRTS